MAPDIKITDVRENAFRCHGLTAPRAHDWEIIKRLFWGVYIRRLQKRAMGEAGKLRAGGVPADRLGCRFEGMDSGALTAMGHLDQIGAKSKCAETQTPSLPGRTPRALRWLHGPRCRHLWQKHLLALGGLRFSAIWLGGMHAN
jgi:hypothetical protein